MHATEPSLTAMIHAHLRASHARLHSPPVYADTTSVRLVPEETRAAIDATMRVFSPAALDALMALAAVRYRVVADRLEAAHARGIRQLVILGAGLDCTGLSLPEWADEWTAFEIDHPSTQVWKRRRIAELGWSVRDRHVFVPCDFERDDLLSSLEASGFRRDSPALVSWFGVVLYLTPEATRATLRDLATFAPLSEVTLTYSEPPDANDPIAREIFARSRPIVDESGEAFTGYYTEAEMDALVRSVGFTTVEHHPLADLNARYFRDRADGLVLGSAERVLTASLRS